MSIPSRLDSRCSFGRRRLFVALAALALLAPVRAGAFEVIGRVVNASGTPIAGAKVELQRVLPRYQRSLQILKGQTAWEAASRVRTSQEGEYLLAVPEAGMWQVEISARGTVPVRCRLTPLVGDETLPDAELETDAGLEVRVEGGDGSAISGAQVWLQPAEAEPRRFRPRERSPWRDRGRYGRTGSDGRVRLARRTGQRARVYALADGFLPARSAEVEVAGTTLRLRPGSPVKVRITDASGAPVANGVLSVAALRWVAASTDERGQAVLYAAPNEPLAVTLELKTGQIEATELVAEAEDLGRQETPIAPVWRLPDPVELAGRVVDQDTREAVAGALVWSSGDAGAFDVSDTDGRYRLLRGSAERWALFGTAPGYGESSIEARRQSDGLRIPTLALARTGALLGRVVDVQGEAIVDAVVRVALHNQIKTAHSDADGAFRLEGVPAEGSYEFATEARGFASDYRRLSVEAGVGIEIVLEPGRSIIGRLVTPDQEPVASGRILATPIEVNPRMWSAPSRMEQWPEAESDAQGRFRLADLPRRPMALVARRDGLADEIVRDLDLADGDGELDVGDIELGWGVDLHGLVQSRDGQPIAGAEVMIFSGAGFLAQGIQYQEDSRRDTKTDDEGRFLVEGLTANRGYNASVRHPDYVDRFVSEIEPGGEEPLEIVLEQGARVAGRVLDSAGAPVGNVSVSVATTAPAEPSGHAMAQGQVVARGRSRANGSFEVTGISAGRLEVSVMPGRGWVAREPLVLTVAGGEERTDLVLRVTRGAVVTGIVTDSNGRPVVGASIRVSGSRTITTFGLVRGTTGFGSEGNTDGDGLYSIQGLDPEAQEAKISVRHADFARLERSVTLRPGDNRLDLVLQKGVSISGVVLEEGGDPVEGAQIQVVQSIASWGGIGSIDSASSSESGRDGSFEIPGMSAGVYQLVARKPGFAESAAERVETTERAGAHVTLTLKEGGTIRGRILGLQPDAFGQVQVFASGGESGLSVGLVGEHGEYKVSNVGFSEGQVTASNQGSGQVVVEEFALDTRGGEVWLDLEFGLGSSLTGTVRLNGEPLTGAQVIAQGANQGAGLASTDLAGSFRIEGLGDGAYRLMVISVGRPSHTENVRVAGDTEIAIEIATVRISGTVIAGEGGEPIPGAHVSVTVEDDPLRSFVWGQATTSSDGAFEVHVPAGRRVLVRAKGDSYAESSRAVETLTEVDIAGLELVLDGGDGLELDVTLWTGLRPDSLSVALVGASGNRVAADTLLGRTAGKLKLQSAPWGEWTLLVASAGSAVVARKVQVPGPPVELVLPQGATITVEIPNPGREITGGKVRLVSATSGVLRLPIFGHVLSEIPVFGSQAQVPFVPAGDWIVELVDSAGTVRRQNVTAVPGELSRVTFE